MARSKRARSRLSSADRLVEALPDRYLRPELGEWPLEALTEYIRGLREWIEGQGVPLKDSQHVAGEVMALIGTSPAEWYQRAAARP